MQTPQHPAAAFAFAVVRLCKEPFVGRNAPAAQADDNRTVRRPTAEAASNSCRPQDARTVAGSFGFTAKAAG